jgi:putative membrane protein
MPKSRIVGLFAAASALALLGCSGESTPESESAETAATEGGETATTTSVEEWRAEEELPEEERVEDRGVATQTGLTDPRFQSAAKGETTLSDGEIAEVTDVVNTGEIEQAQLATSKASNPRVREFANMMIRDHTRAKQEASQIVRQQNLVTQDGALATQIENQSTQMLQSLRAADPGDFDMVYISGQVEQHQKALDTLDKQLIPSADGPQLKAQLEEARDMISRHLTEAREIQRSLGSRDRE